jgi:hypothetical protein
LWFSAASGGPGIVKHQIRTFASFAFLQSVSQSILAGSPQRSGSSRGLLSPSAQFRVQGLPMRQISRPAYVPPSGFGYPPGGFLPWAPSEFCFTLTALVGFPLRSLCSLQGVAMFPLRRAHLPFCLTSDGGIATSTVKPAAAPGFQPLKRARRRDSPKRVFLQQLPWGYAFLGSSAHPP